MNNEFISTMGPSLIQRNITTNVCTFSQVKVLGSDSVFFEIDQVVLKDFQSNVSILSHLHRS